MTDDSAIESRVRAFLESAGVNRGRVVVAVSGGPDSIALLRVLIATVPGPVVVAHLNHELRGAESDEDQAFVVDLVDRFRSAGRPVELRSARIDVAAAGGNAEATARRARYDWLASVAREVGATVVATGHTADDQAETVLFQLLRGTGLDGLAGIAARRALGDGVELIRPMLTVTRPDVLDYLGRLGQDFRTDRTNADLSRTRSRIRHDLLPRLRADYNPRIVTVLARLADQAADWCRDQAAAADALVRAAERPRAGGVLVFDRAALARAPRRRRRAAWRQVWAREGWPRRAMGFREWDRLAALCRGGPAAVDLPGSVRARRHGPLIQVGPVERES